MLFIIGQVFGDTEEWIDKSVPTLLFCFIATQGIGAVRVYCNNVIQLF